MFESLSLLYRVDLSDTNRVKMHDYTFDTKIAMKGVFDEGA